MRKLLILAVLMCGSVYVFAGPSGSLPFLVGTAGIGRTDTRITSRKPAVTNAILDVMCDDYVHGGMPGDQWDREHHRPRNRQHTADSL